MVPKYQRKENSEFLFENGWVIQQQQQQQQIISKIKKVFKLTTGNGMNGWMIFSFAVYTFWVIQ
ncbi:hypothetical protein DERP_008549 [Dermatophagoides pteronyssinus]|uniref:Uncharacterized protein n=1 Tax=Dermatophagoides pteronyssinus TaxID=6956 RepID=A0ABQ8IWR4_DERPT|nr:hypothetical protein DERP_008549 [Dermatophagoides pteronyssinus]